MNFPEDLNDDRVAQYKAIFASGDGERLLREWEDCYFWSGEGDRPLDSQTFTNSIVNGNLDFAMACLNVLPDRFFDVKKPLVCREMQQPQDAICQRLKANVNQPQEAERYYPLLEKMAERGWDFFHVIRFGVDRTIMPVLYHLTDIRGTAPLLRRLLPHIGGAEAVRSYSDSCCGEMGRLQMPTTLLHRAVDKQDIEMVRFLVREVGIDPNTTDSLGRTALMMHLWTLSISTGFADSRKLERAKQIVSELVAFGLDLDHRDNEGETALLYAVMDDNTEAVRFLIEKGASRKVLDKDGRSLIERAEAEGHEGVARLLLAAEVGDSIDAAMPNEDGQPAAASRPSGGMTL